jgi:hypothetical protein
MSLRKLASEVCEMSEDGEGATEYTLSVMKRIALSAIEEALHLLDRSKLAHFFFKEQCINLMLDKASFIGSRKFSNFACNYITKLCIFISAFFIHFILP